MQTSSKTWKSTVLLTWCWHPTCLLLLCNAAHQSTVALWASQPLHDGDKPRSVSRTGYVIQCLEISCKVGKWVFFKYASIWWCERDLVLQLYVHSSSMAPIPAQLSYGFLYNKPVDCTRAKLRNTQISRSHINRRLYEMHISGCLRHTSFLLPLWQHVIWQGPIPILSLSQIKAYIFVWNYTSAFLFSHKL